MSLNVNWSVGSVVIPKNTLPLSLFKIYDADVSCWIAISPARAPSIVNLSSSLATVKTLNGLKAGIWSILISPA